ncbi:hypothetical protein ACH5RR_016495 [Cinchona calisaya]|uniref:Polygalacturonase n=1 Tax=Cinchona calisaya TaxID=153742 RepID=A0ABD2ZY68_9GENT
MKNENVYEDRVKAWNLEAFEAFIKAWDAACKSGKAAKVFFPKGTFLSGEVVFQGPCNTPTPIIIEIRGTILASTDLSLFTQGVWISIENVNGIVVAGGGTLDGQGACCWKYSTQEEDSANPLPVAWKIMKNENVYEDRVKAWNSEAFEMTWSCIKLWHCAVYQAKLSEAFANFVGVARVAA